MVVVVLVCFCFKQKTAYEMRISDWSSDGCSSDLAGVPSTAENRYATGLNLGTGVALNGTARIDTQGAFQTTGNGLDVEIDGDRKSVATGKRVSVRVDLRGRRIIKKKKENTKQIEISYKEKKQT